jgi:hypothetical protein
MSESFIIPDETIISKIYQLRNKSVMLDRDLAELYDVKYNSPKILDNFLSKLRCF